MMSPQNLVFFDDMTFKIWYGENVIALDKIPHIVKVTR